MIVPLGMNNDNDVKTNPHQILRRDSATLEKYLYTLIQRDSGIAEPQCYS